MIPVTKETVEATYTWLLHFPPFNRWNLPAAERLNFAVDHLKSMWADYDPETKTVRVSSAKVSTYPSLLQAVAHEMIHVREDAVGKWSDKHDTAFFKRSVKLVCKHWGFDPANL